MRLRRSVLWSDPRVKPRWGEAEIDWSHPLAWGLEACWLYNEGGGTLQDMCGKYPAAINLASTITRDPGASGYSINCTNTASTTDGATISPALVTGTAWSWESYMRPTTTGDSFGATLVTSGGLGIFIKHAAGTMAHIGSDVVVRESVRSYTFGFWRQFAATQTASTVNLYEGGFPDGTFTGLSLGSLSLVTMFNRSDNTFAGDIAYQRVWTRQLSDGDMLWLAAEPYAMFMPVVRRRYFNVTALPVPKMGRRIYILP